MTIKKRIKKQAVMLAVLLLFASSPVGAQAKQRTLVPMGCTIGISVSTNGMMVAGLASTNGGQSPSPAAEAGVLPGDLITGLGGEKIANSEDFRKAAEKLTGEPVSVTIERNGETIQLTIEPNMESGGPEVGMWLRDGVSGIGTMTYYDPATGLYGGLGHSISDAESGVVIPLGSGEIMQSFVSEVVRSEVGKPGELHGVFDMNSVCGSILLNTGFGIFGELSKGIPPSENALPVATEEETKLGKATILANISDSSVEEFDVEIVRLYRNGGTGKCMMIKITDDELIEKTGGIVQGMSGSPIIQNGMLVGAVTHVLMNDPTKGFAVSIEKMLDQSETLGETGRAA